MSLDDFKTTPSREDLAHDPPDEFSSWVDAEPGEPGWFGKAEGNKKYLNNEVFDPEEQLFAITMDLVGLDESECYLISNTHQSLEARR